MRRTATPYYYVRRIYLINLVFRSDWRLEFITPGENPSVVTSQPWAHPADITSPLPSQEEIESLMTALGFNSIPSSQFEWFREIDGVRISDARQDNFIKAKDGVIPVDLQASND
jgi:hypothetical protein